MINYNPYIYKWINIIYCNNESRVSYISLSGRESRWKEQREREREKTKSREQREEKVHRDTQLEKVFFWSDQI